LLKCHEALENIHRLSCSDQVKINLNKEGVELFPKLDKDRIKEFVCTSSKRDHKIAYWRRMVLEGKMLRK